MGNVNDLLVLLALFAVIGLWLKASAARERATAEARRQCERYGLQLLDETVGLRALRLRRVDGWLRLERSYGFEVSIDGADREPGQLWMLGHTLSELSLPSVLPSAPATEPPDGGAEPARQHVPLALPGERADQSTVPPEADGNVIPFRPRRRDSNRLH